MREVVKTLLAGLAGAARGIIILTIGCVLVTSLAPAVVSLANRGTIDLDAFSPRVAQSSSKSAQVHVDGSPTEQAAVREAIDKLAWPVDTSAFKVKVVPRDQLPPGAAGMYTYPSSVVYISAEVVNEPTRYYMSHVLAHEIGHMIDWTHLDDNARSEFLQLRGYDPSASWTDQSTPWEARPEEDFAEVFAALDAPSSPALIQTSAGRIENPKAMRKLIDRFQDSPKQVPNLTAASALVSPVLSSAETIINDDGPMLRTLLILAIIYATACAMRAMREVRPRKSRASRRMHPPRPLAT